MVKIVAAKIIEFITTLPKLLLDLLLRVVKIQPEVVNK